MWFVYINYIYIWTDDLFAEVWQMIYIKKIECK